MATMLSITISNKQQRQQFEHATGPVEFGRGPRREARRLMIEDIYVSRDQLRVEELPDGRARVENLSQRRDVALEDGTVLAVGSQRDLPLPLRMTVGDTLIEIVLVPEESFDKESLMTISQPVRRVRELRGSLTLGQLGEAPAPATLAHWLETVIGLQRSVVGTAEFYELATRAMVELIGLDLGLVLLRRDDNWAVAASHAVNDRTSVRYSRTLLKIVLTERRTFYQDLRTLKDPSASIQALDAVVVSPVFGVHDDIVGVLYGVRSGPSLIRGGIKPLEAQIVQLLAAAVGANVARTEATRLRVQFEQFFSAELVRELERRPDLLEGRDQLVTILVSDLRGFTPLSERLGPQVTCRLIRDMMECMTERIAEQGGVIVDYAGDGILAMWNAPVAQEDHAARACRAALAMQGEVAGLNARWQEQAGGALQLGVGLNTGPAQVGNTGCSRRFKYGPHGHTVNLASRVQDACKKLGLPLLITQATRDALADRFVVARAPRVPLAGVKEDVALYELMGDAGSRP
jgi:adenylate cyclase